MIKPQDKKRISLFLAFAFGISWAGALVIYLTGGLENSLVFDLGGAQVSLASLLLPTVIMFGPAIANVLTRWVTKEGKQNLYLQPHFDQGRWKYFLAAWVLPGILTIFGMILFFLLFPRYFDAELSTLRPQIDPAGTGEVNIWLIVGIQTTLAIVVSPLINALPTFGEEFGWRGYLQPKLMPLGGRKAILWTGVIWGIWHWPVIIMGYNYGFNYFGAPFLGPLAFLVFTIAASALFGWVTIKAANVWPAVIGHGALNGIAALSLLIMQGEPDTLLGPTPVGLIGGAGFIILGVIFFRSPHAFEPELEAYQSASPGEAD